MRNLNVKELMSELQHDQHALNMCNSMYADQDSWQVNAVISHERHSQAGGDPGMVVASYQWSHSKTGR